MIDYVSYSFETLASPVAFGGAGEADDYGEDICPALLANFSSTISGGGACDEAPCSDVCRTLVNEVCNTVN